MQIHSLLYIPVLFTAWAMTFPMEALALIDGLKQRLTQYVIASMTRKEVRMLKERFRKWGKLEGYKEGLIDEVFDQHALKINQRIETRYYQLSLDELLSRGD